MLPSDLPVLIIAEDHSDYHVPELIENVLPRLSALGYSALTVEYIHQTSDEILPILQCEVKKGEGCLSIIERAIVEKCAVERKSRAELGFPSTSELRTQGRNIFSLLDLLDIPDGVLRAYATAQAETLGVTYETAMLYIFDKAMRLQSHVSYQSMLFMAQELLFLIYGIDHHEKKISYKSIFEDKEKINHSFREAHMAKNIANLYLEGAGVISMVGKSHAIPIHKLLSKQGVPSLIISRTSIELSEGSEPIAQIPLEDSEVINNLLELLRKNKVFCFFNDINIIIPEDQQPAPAARRPKF